MATFTLTLQDALEYNPDIGLNDYPIFDEAHRPELNRKIIDRFLFREIAYETHAMFAHHLGRTMREIMPLYNRYYESELLKIEPLLNVDVSTTGKSTANSEATGTSKSESGTESKSRAVSSDLPQNQLSGNGDYATAAQDNISGTAVESTANDSTTNSQDGETESSTRGIQGSQALALLQYRETFLNIDVEILDRLEPLFMQIWANGDEYTEGSSYYGYGYYGFSF